MNPTFKQVTKTRYVQLVAELAQEIFVQHYTKLTPKVAAALADKYQSDILTDDEIHSGVINYFLIYLGTEPVGYFALDRGPAGAMCLSRLFIKEKARGQGIGRSIVAYAQKLAEGDGRSRLYLRIWARDLKAEGFDTLHILHNNSYSVEGYAICGTRGWLFDVGEPHDEKVMNREIGRLKMSLDAAEPGLEKLVFLHYPPVYTGTSAPEIVATLKEYGIKRCFYGHLHGNAIRYAVQGNVDGIQYKLVSADGLRFCPYRIN